MTPLIIDNAIQARIAEVVAFAKANVRTWKGALVPGDQEPFTVHVPLGFKVVFSVDETTDPQQLARHLSCSVTATNRQTVPSPEAMRMLAEAFGFGRELYHLGPMEYDPPWVIHAIELFPRTQLFPTGAPP